MKKNHLRQRPYITAVLLGLLCTFITALGTAVPQIIGLDANIQIIVTTMFLAASIAIGIFIMKKSELTLAEYGFQKSKGETNQKVWWYLPLLAIELVPVVIAGFRFGVSVTQYIVLFFFTVAISFNEEIYFRGLALKSMEQKGRKKAIIWSSVLFGVLHMANLFNGRDYVYVILQVAFAFLVGFVLAEIVSITNSLWIAIIWHAAHDYISYLTEDTMAQTALIIIAIQVGVLFLYAIGIWNRAKGENRKVNYK